MPIKDSKKSVVARLPEEGSVSKCELIETCIFFNDQMSNMPSTSAVYKKVFCEKDFATCGRYLIFKSIGREHVPKDLYPNQGDRARSIIDSAR